LMEAHKFTVVATDHQFPTAEPEKRFLEPLGAKVEFRHCRTEDEVIEVAKDADALVNNAVPITRRVVSELDHVRVIVRTGVGFDNVDVEAATEKGIMVANVPRYGREEVADHAIALLLSMIRKVPQYDKLVREGAWDKHQTLWPIPCLQGLTLGVIGFGRIGQQVARKAKEAFKMKVVAYDPFVPREKMEQMGVKPVNLKTLLKKSDAISIHVPLTKETVHMIGEKELGLMKRTAHIVKTARGPIIDEKALRKALSEGWITGAALDVMEKEPPDPSSPLLKLKNLIVTPHVAWYSQYSMEDLHIKAVKEVARVLRGRLPLNLVNKGVLTKLGNRGPQRRAGNEHHRSFRGVSE